MSRIYSNDRLSALRVNTVEWQGVWPPASTQTSGPASSTKSGLLIEGTITNRSRRVILNSSSKNRYFVLHVKVRSAHQRVFDTDGKELEPNFSETTKVRTGYLNSSYKTVPKGDTDALTFSQLMTKFKDCNDKLNAITALENREGCVALWMEESRLTGIELDDGDEVRVKTAGYAPFLESLAKLDSVSSVTCNYAGGEKVGASWTDKVFVVKAAGAGDDFDVKGVAGGRSKDNEGAADDEWGD